MGTLRRYPTATFFLLTYAFSWSLWRTFGRAYLGGNMFALPGLVLGLFGPGLVSIFLARAFDAGPRGRRHGHELPAFALAWLAATVLIALDQVLNEGRLVTAPVVVASAMAALPPAFVVASVFSTAPGVRRHLQTLVHPRGAARYYLLALVLFAVIWTVGIPITLGLGLQVPQRVHPPAVAKTGLWTAVALSFCYTFLPNALSEEVGWRGFALPRLQARHSPLVSSVVLWVFWAAWHAPAYFGGFQSQSAEDTFVEWALMLPVTVVFTWFYNRTGGSLLATALLHPAMNTATRFLPVTVGGVLLLFLVAAAAASRDRMWRMAPRSLLID